MSFPRSPADHRPADRSGRPARRSAPARRWRISHPHQARAIAEVQQLHLDSTRHAPLQRSPGRARPGGIPPAVYRATRADATSDSADATASPYRSVEQSHGADVAVRRAQRPRVGRPATPAGLLRRHQPAQLRRLDADRSPASMAGSAEQCPVAGRVRDDGRLEHLDAVDERRPASRSGCTSPRSRIPSWRRRIFRPAASTGRSSIGSNPSTADLVVGSDGAGQRHQAKC